jgi:lipopolysaccharide/colanic/teichoic acid biosynthesis glycosyltransferase
MRKRLFDLCFAGWGLVILGPVLLVLAILVKLADRGPVLFRQQRVGQGERLFWILKFRSMVVDAERLGLSVTKDGDARITRIGRFLRKTKLDELPQLWNVLCGEMSFVGPRPEVPRYVTKYSEAQKRVLALKPGITDLATLEFRNEEELLRMAPDTEQFYLAYCVPRKIELNLTYAESASRWQDTKIILRTLGLIRKHPIAEALGKPANVELSRSPRNA